jgi:hypothetical protein
MPVGASTFGRLHCELLLTLLFLQAHRETEAYYRLFRFTRDLVPGESECVRVCRQGPWYYCCCCCCCFYYYYYFSNNRGSPLFIWLSG